MYVLLALKVQCVSALWSNIHKVAQNERKGQGEEEQIEMLLSLWEETLEREKSVS